MISRTIRWSIAHRPLVLGGALILACAAVVSLRGAALDAIPDLSDVQVIVRTTVAQQAPQVVESQVTFPLSSALLSLPGAAAVRGYSMFGESLVYVVFRDGTDPYWARTRVLERLSQVRDQLPSGASPTLGPDASGVGWIFEYALVDREHRYDPDQMRSVQDSFLKYELQSLPGVAEVASIGGMVRQFQVEVIPGRLAAYQLTLERIGQAIRDSNAAGGGSVLEMGHAEYIVRAPNTLKDLADFQRIPLGVGAQGVPIRLEDVARIQIGHEERRGIADLDGAGDVTGGIVVMRYGHNALATIAQVKTRLEELRSGLPAGMELVVTYDRSGVIERSVRTLARELIEQSLVVALVCLAFLARLRSSLVIVASLPLGVLAALFVMERQGVSANVMSLGGIAIAIGAMIDAAVVMIENMHRHLEHANARQGGEGPAPDHWALVESSAREVGPALFMSLSIIAVSFLPLLTLTGQEGRLFSPLVYTKTYAMAAGAILAVTLTPVLIGYLVRGPVAPELGNPLNRFLHAVYRPVLLSALRKPGVALAAALVVVASAAWPLTRLGGEFMPALDEGDLLYMPSMPPGVSVDEAAGILQNTDRLIAGFPEVERVFGKAGRADSATDPAPLSMLETTILLKPRDRWPNGGTTEDLVQRLDGVVRLPGLTNSWGFPIRTRIEMQSTSMRTPLGIRVTGPELEGIGDLASRISAAIGNGVPGTRNAFADRAEGGHYIDVVLDRTQAARYGVTAADVQRLVNSAIGGETIDTVVLGRNRYTVNLRYPRAFRDSLDAISQSRVSTPSGAQVPLGLLARIAISDGPVEIRSENGRLVAFVYLDFAGRDMAGYIAQAQAVVARDVKIEPGYAIAWTGQYENLLHARERLLWVLPLTMAAVVSMLHLHFRSAMKVLIVLGGMPLALAGGFWLLHALGYHASVAVAAGFIALAGVAAEFGLVMLLYLDQAIAKFREEGKLVTRDDLHEAIVQGALLRIRPKMMTVCVILAGLVPVMLGQGTGADVMKRIAAPLVGGMVTAPLLSLVLVPVIYAWWLGRGLPAPVAPIPLQESRPRGP